MTFRRIITLGALLTGLAVAPEALAQAGQGVKPGPTSSPQTSSSQVNTASGFPSGSWQQTCIGPRWEGRTLVATCRTSYGAMVYASFDTNRPFTTLSNCDGVLRPVAHCSDERAASPAPVASPALPSGNWASSCRSASLDNGVLSAVCQRPGRWVQHPTADRFIWQEADEARLRLPLNGYTGAVSLCEGELVRQPRCPG